MIDLTNLTNRWGERPWFQRLGLDAANFSDPANIPLADLIAQIQTGLSTMRPNMPAQALENRAAHMGNRFEKFSEQPMRPAKPERPAGSGFSPIQGQGTAVGNALAGRTISNAIANRQRTPSLG